MAATLFTRTIFGMSAYFRWVAVIHSFQCFFAHVGVLTGKVDAVHPHHLWHVGVLQVGAEVHCSS